MFSHDDVSVRARLLSSVGRRGRVVYLRPMAGSKNEKLAHVNAGVRNRRNGCPCEILRERASHTRTSATDGPSRADQGICDRRLILARLHTVGGRRGSRPVWTSLGAPRVAALTELS